MPLVPPVINAAMDSAFLAALEAMENLSAANAAAVEANAAVGKDTPSVPNSPAAIRAAGAAAFAGIAGPAITAYIKSATVLPGIPVATAGSPAAQTGATTGPGVIQ